MRKWRITYEERAKWGMMRREESRHALAALGAPADNGVFLGYPDYELGALARRGDRRITDALRAIVDVFNPTLVVAPSILDLHSDHRAMALFTHEAAPGRMIITYVVHGIGPAGRIAARLELTKDEQARKRAAIERHASQLWLSRGRFLSYARPVEIFLRAEHDILRPDTFWWTWRCKTLHGLRVVLRKGSDVS
jgi:LmbE family N-acetylglucosaminyl deacetylase